MLLLALAIACRFTSVASPQPRPSATLAPEVRACPIPPGQPGLPGPRAREILDYLNRGGSIATLDAYLADVGQLATPSVQLDIDGDLLEDLVFATLDQQSGSVQVFRCSGEGYELAYLSVPLPAPAGVSIHSVQDLNGDPISDLLISREQCGAHTCTAVVEALIWHAGRLENRFVGDTSDLPSPTLDLARLSDQRVEIRITATGIASVGAGPYRQHVRIWTWDEDQIAFTASVEETLDSNFRIHRLHDADDAAAAGNFDAALAYYQQVIDDPELDDWLDGEAGHAALAAYARFRRLTTILELGDLDSAEQALAVLLQEHPQGTDGHGFAALGEQFWAALAGSLGDSGALNAEALEYGCQAAQAYAITHAEQTLDQLYYGYANRTYGPESICPLRN
jgi:hypothetical protein